MIRHKRAKTGYKQVVVSIKMPEELRDKIDILAQRKLITRNRWLVNVATNAAQWKEDK